MNAALLWFQHITASAILATCRQSAIASTTVESTAPVLKPALQQSPLKLVQWQSMAQTLPGHVLLVARTSSFHYGAKTNSLRFQQASGATHLMMTSPDPNGLNGFRMEVALISGYKYLRYLSYFRCIPTMSAFLSGAYIRPLLTINSNSRNIIAKIAKLACSKQHCLSCLPCLAAGAAAEQTCSIQVCCACFGSQTNLQHDC